MALKDNEKDVEKRTVQRRTSSKKVSEEKRSSDRRTTLQEKKRASDRRVKSTETSEEKRSNSRRKSVTITDEKRNHERRNTVLEVPVDNRKKDRRKACPSSSLPTDVLEDRRKEQRRNSSIAHTVASPVTRFKSGVALDTNKRKKDRRQEEEKKDVALDQQESDIIIPIPGGNRKQERRNSSLRGEPPNSPRKRFKSGVPADSDKRSTDRRAEKPLLDSSTFIKRRPTDRRIHTGSPCLSLIPGGKDRRTGAERRIIPQHTYTINPEAEHRKGKDRREKNIDVKDDRRMGDRRDKAKLNRRDNAIASGVDPQNNRRAKVEAPSISSERRDSGFASGFRPDLDRRKHEEKSYEELQGVASGNHENLDLLKESAPSDDLFVTGCTFSENNTELHTHPRKKIEKKEEKEEPKERFRTGCQDLPLKD